MYASAVCLLPPPHKQNSEFCSGESPSQHYCQLTWNAMSRSLLASSERSGLSLILRLSGLSLNSSAGVRPDFSNAMPIWGCYKYTGKKEGEKDREKDGGREGGREGQREGEREREREGGREGKQCENLKDQWVAGA